MTRATSQMRRLAKRLMEYEWPADKSNGLDHSAVFAVTDKLHPHLATLMGGNGFRALFSRALALATAENSRLRGTHVKADGTLAGLEALRAQLEPAEFHACEAAVLARVLELLVAFIGPSLAARLMGEIWLQISLDEEDFNMGAEQ